ncbi:Platelet endothelial cell adhesion molecule [Merluccius polli]|uniref:Platelet endothelial cell adhesion molecule n=1 Tax=Merluccius polli TaxID=89951 RepID=A0AA47N973_MERPO|nr:Platelet endothelial cell adhesion molecule [Merluccius polli]
MLSFSERKRTYQDRYTEFGFTEAMHNIRAECVICAKHGERAAATTVTAAAESDNPPTPPHLTPPVPLHDYWGWLEVGATFISTPPTVHQEPSPRRATTRPRRAATAATATRMGPLSWILSWVWLISNLCLTPSPFAFLFRAFPSHAGAMVEAQTHSPVFVIRDVTLTVMPDQNLPRDTNVTLRCRASLSISGSQVLRREYSFYKENTVIYRKITSSSEDMMYLLPSVRVSSTGHYMCKIVIEGRERNSDLRKLTVTGLARPVLYLEKQKFSEGEDVTARCSAPGESGSINFHFYVDDKELQYVAQYGAPVTSNQVDAKLRIRDTGRHSVRCDYTVQIPSAFVKSDSSNSFTVTIEELSVKPILEISPGQKIFEGDQLSISCKLEGYYPNPDGISLVLNHGEQLLSTGQTEVNHSMAVFVQDSGELECRMEMGQAVKTANVTLSVIELFSVPRLSMSPAEVFQGDEMRLTCSSEVLVAERLNTDDITYALKPAGSLVAEREAGRFSGKALTNHFNYICTARARGIDKDSKALLVMPKVSVVKPKLSAKETVVLGRPFQIQCASDYGSLPINYTLLKTSNFVSVTTVSQPHQKALFNITIQHPLEISQYECKAENNRQKDGERSERLNASIIVPLSQATLTVVPSPGDISEGNKLILICGATGTLPITFKWYRSDISQPLIRKTVNAITADHQIADIGRNNSATYYCEALNQAQNLVRSQLVPIEVHLALWKKGVIAASCLLVLCVLVLLCVLRYKSRRGKKEVAAELSVKPSSSKSGDSLTRSLTHDTEVYTAATDSASRYDGTEGRATNGTRDSVASLPIDISNRSSCSIPATV